MKRVITIFLIALLSVAVFVGCGRDNGNVSTDPNGKIGTSEKNDSAAPTKPSSDKKGAQNSNDSVMDDIGDIADDAGDMIEDIGRNMNDSVTNNERTEKSSKN